MKLSKIGKILIIVGGLGAIFFLAFQYAFLTDFPIGHDAGHHVAVAINVEKGGFFNFSNYKSILYPIPLTLFALFHKITQLAWPQLFLYTICFFLFLTATAWAYFTTRATDKWEIGIIAGIFLVSSRWLSDALRIGFFAEAWGWFVFVLGSYFLVKRKFWPLTFSMILLFFSHPLVLMVFLLILIIYLVIIMVFEPKKEDKFFIYQIISLLFLAFASVLAFYPEKIHEFLKISQFAYLEGARSLKNIMIDSDKRRILIYLLAIPGIIKGIQLWKRNEIKFLFILLFVSIILSQLYLWGINFWVFRFYPYLEMAFAAFAAIGLYYLVELLPSFIQKNKIIRLLILGFLVVLLIFPNFDVNKKITLWQKNNYQILAICPPADREAFEWVKNNLSSHSRFIAPTKWGSWLRPLGNVEVIEWDDIFAPSNNYGWLLSMIEYYNIDYIYFSSIQVENPQVEKNQKIFEPIYQKDGARIYYVRRNEIP